MVVQRPIDEEKIANLPIRKDFLGRVKEICSNYEVRLCELCFFRTLSNLRRERMVNTMFDEELDTTEDEPQPGAALRLREFETIRLGSRRLTLPKMAFTVDACDLAGLLIPHVAEPLWVAQKLLCLTALLQKETVWRCFLRP
ncbi:TPA: hypothetical protein ACH1VU_006468 [Pseudomonas aeruginosa]|nr:hypothetical protein [Pseudomonas aeruginosa]MBG5781702.1 hypothetical protein [Pseudomonas aeruginosa]